MDSIGDLLGKRIIQEPDEILLAKQFIADSFNESASVAIKDDSLIITVQSAALASTLRMRLRQLQAACNTSRRIVLRIA